MRWNARTGVSVTINDRAMLTTPPSVAVPLLELALGLVPVLALGWLRTPSSARRLARAGTLPLNQCTTLPALRTSQVLLPRRPPLLCPTWMPLPGRFRPTTRAPGARDLLRPLRRPTRRTARSRARHPRLYTTTTTNHSMTRDSCRPRRGFRCCPTLAARAPALARQHLLSMRRNGPHVHALALTPNYRHLALLLPLLPVRGHRRCHIRSTRPPRLTCNMPIAARLIPPLACPTIPPGVDRRCRR